MHAATKAMKDAIAALGIPRRAIRAGTDMGITHATVRDPAHIALIAKHADELTSPWLGVVLKKAGCGCIWSAFVTTRHQMLNRVTTLNSPEPCYTCRTKQPTTPTGPDPMTTHPYAGTDKTRQETGAPGHCDDCAARGHIAAHPDLGCGDVGCDKHHPDENPATPTHPCPPWCTSDHPHDPDFFRIHITTTAAVDEHAGVRVGIVQTEDNGTLSTPLIFTSVSTKLAPNGDGPQNLRLTPKDATALADILDAIETDSPTLHLDLADALRTAAELANSR
ncbi:hypothetical protein [Nonomuraea glycinis]|uniref:hypothetical protein n=1 Tax=Nonomuraea glycinis TaxID=2047744 RepID=UPI0033B84EB8